MGKTQVKGEAVADASVLIILARAGRLELLEKTLGAVLVPQAVKRECVEAAPERPDAARVAAAFARGSLIEVDDPSTGELARLNPNLGRGELAALELARSRRLPLRADDASARRAARLLGIPSAGCLGVLARAYDKKLLDRQGLVDAVADVVKAGLWVSPDVIESFWRALGGR